MRPQKEIKPAEAVIEDECIVIRLPIENIPIAVGGAVYLGLMAPAEILDAKAFALSVVEALNAEDEEGTTAIHQMFDQAFDDAIEGGAEGVKLPDD
jgi:hypothetical protein